MDETEYQSSVGRYLAFLGQDILTEPSKLNVLHQDESLKEMLSGVDTEEFDVSDLEHLSFAQDSPSA